MSELGFQNQNQFIISHSGFTPRDNDNGDDASPDSVIFSFFSSTSASLDRSDSPSDNSLYSQFSNHLVGHESQERSSGPDLNKQALKHKNSRNSGNIDKAKVKKEDTEKFENHVQDSASSSFSLALKGCQERRSRSEAVSRKSDRSRPASLDFNDRIEGNSPRFAVVKNNSSVSHRGSGTFPSPGTPKYQHNTSVGMQKGWSSERVPLPQNGSRRHVSAALFPFNNNGRTLPSKWEDAERWIFSPVSGDSIARQTSLPVHQNQRPKAKSGPLGPPGVAFYSVYSPAMPMFDATNMVNINAGSPFSSRVIAADALAIQCVDRGGNFPMRTDPSIARSVSVHGCSEMLRLTNSSQEEKISGRNDSSANISRDVSRRNMATQMSPESSTHSSPKRLTYSAKPIVELHRSRSSKSDMKDVQVDERVTVTRWSKKHKSLVTRKGSETVDDWTKQSVESRSSAWEVSETTRSISRVKREDSRITAWENLQKAKAEAAIRKLEMKLEKKRSSSMDKIMNKLRSAQRKAQDMRSSVLANDAHQVTGSSHKLISFRKTRQISSLSGCFTCHAL